MMAQKPDFPDVVLAIDVESNGCSLPEIIELAIVLIEAGTIKCPPVAWMIKPIQPIKFFATKIHGIGDAEVAQSPPLWSVRKDISSLLKSHAIVAHNSHVDYKLLRLSLPDWRPIAVYDSLRLARYIVPELPSHSLSSLIAHFGIADDLKRHGLFQAHRASYDAVAAAYLFVTLIEQAQKKGIGITRALGISKMNIDYDRPKQGILL